MDRYTSFAELACVELAGRDYTVRGREHPGSRLLLIAPHGGRIENGTSELATLIAGADHSLFCFEGRKLTGTNRDLHLTSHRFDHPQCLTMLARARIACAIHGCRGQGQVFVGGLDGDLGELIARRLRAAGVRASASGHAYPGTHPHNICNRGVSGAGVQLELTSDLRSARARARLAPLLRAALREYLSTCVA